MTAEGESVVEPPMQHKASVNDSISGLPGCDPGEARLPSPSPLSSWTQVRAFDTDEENHKEDDDSTRQARGQQRVDKRDADCMCEEEADKGPGGIHHAMAAAVHGPGDVDSMLRDDRDHPRESVTILLGNSDRYEGEVLDGLMDGRGHYTFADGNVYVGEWRRGKREGSGTFSWSNGDVYDGEWRDGKMAGRGRIVLDKKLTYDGDWLNGKCHGKGHCRYHNGDKFVGPAASMGNRAKNCDVF